jgi:Peptidase family S41/N-terminal domain of Peptidase_S41 in eukaryotic IRBP
MKIAALSVTLLLAPLAVAQPRPQPDTTIDAAERTKTIETLLDRLGARYVFPDKAALMQAAVRTRLKNKEYDGITSAQAFAKKLTEDLAAVAHDKHLRVDYFPGGPPPEPGKGPPREDREPRRSDGGVGLVERLAGNVGYIELRGFLPPELSAGAVAAAFHTVASTDALIIDLRRNGGGNPQGVALVCSYLFGPEPVHLNDLHWREGDRTEESWTRREVPGPRYERKPVYVVTSSTTFSGAEEFAYDLQALKRATIVGEVTGGGAHPGGGVALGPHFGAWIPMGRAVNPITRTSWEGTGVEPDVKIDAAQALKAARLAALRKAGKKGSAEVTREIALLQKELAPR